MKPPYTIYKTKSKWIKDLKLKVKIIKFLEENIGTNLHDREFGNSFLNMTPKVQATKADIDKLGFIKIKNIFASRHYQVHSVYYNKISQAR